MRCPRRSMTETRARDSRDPTRKREDKTRRGSALHAEDEARAGRLAGSVVLAEPGQHRAVGGEERREHDRVDGAPLDHIFGSLHAPPAPLTEEQAPDRPVEEHTVVPAA